MNFIYPGLTFWCLNYLVMHCFSQILARQSKIPLISVGFILSNQIYNLILFGGCCATSVLSVWTCFWLVAAAEMQSNVPVVPMNKCEVNADFVSLFFGPGCWTLSPCFWAGVLDFAVLARPAGGLLGVTSCSLFRMSRANAGRRPRALLGRRVVRI